MISWQVGKDNSYSRMLDVANVRLLGKFKGAESMITARIALDDLVEEGFEQLVKRKDHHSKIIATPRPDLLLRKR